ncbi:MAG: hypothetical protein OXC44_03905 [Proteobacteria bacterium]|nr:hypothetical protein [Pseudomonadota bacterium]
MAQSSNPSLNSTSPSSSHSSSKEEEHPLETLRQTKHASTAIAASKKAVTIVPFVPIHNEKAPSSSSLPSSKLPSSSSSTNEVKPHKEKEHNKTLSIPLEHISICVFSALAIAIILSIMAAGYVIDQFPSPTATNTNQNSTESLVIWPSGISSKDMETVVSRNLFNQDSSPSDVLEEAPKQRNDGMVKSTLPLKLIGTVYGSNPRDGIAMIQNTDKKLINSFFVGSRLLENVTLLEIHQNKIILDHDGVLEYIEKERKPIVRRKRETTSSRLNMPSLIERSVPINSTGRLSQFKEEGYEFREKEIKMTESYKNKLLTQDFSKVLQDAKADPYLVNGKLAGFRLTRIRQNSIYEKSGFANGDIVTEINGIQLTSVSQAISVLQAARNASRLEITVTQNGATNVIEVTVGQ